MDQRLRNRVCLARSRFCSATPPGIQTTWFVLAARGFRRLHDPANRVERSTCVDHTDSSADAREFERRRWLSTARGIQISWRTFPVLLAAAFCRFGLGGNRQLAPRE